MNILMQMNKKSKSKPESDVKSSTKTDHPHIRRLISEWNEWEEIKCAKLEFPDKSKVDHVIITIKPNNGYWENASIKFDLKVPNEYPYDPPKVICLSNPIYHPHINFNGNVCLNILRQNWSPASCIRDVIFGLILIFDCPDPYDALPNDCLKRKMQASYLLLNDKDEFAKLVKETLKGGYIEKLNKTFDKLYN